MRNQYSRLFSITTTISAALMLQALLASHIPLVIVRQMRPPFAKFSFGDHWLWFRSLKSPLYERRHLEVSLKQQTCNGEEIHQVS